MSNIMKKNPKFIECSFENCYFDSECIIDNQTFKKCTFINQNMSNIMKKNPKFIEYRFENCYFDFECIIDKQTFKNCTFKNQDMSGIMKKNPEFTECSFIDCYFDLIVKNWNELLVKDFIFINCDFTEQKIEDIAFRDIFKDCKFSKKDLVKYSKLNSDTLGNESDNESDNKCLRLCQN